MLIRESELLRVENMIVDSLKNVNVYYEVISDGWSYNALVKVTYNCGDSDVKIVRSSFDFEVIRDEDDASNYGDRLVDAKVISEMLVNIIMIDLASAVFKHEGYGIYYND